MTEESVISPIPLLIEDFKQGKMVIIVDDEDRENEGDLIIASEFATPEVINFMITHARGLVCLTLTQQRCEQLNLPLMVRDNRSAHHTNFTVSIEAAEGVTTGISAFDRAKTISVAIDENAQPADIVQPGHIFPLMTNPGGVLTRAGHTEAGHDLAILAGLKPTSVLCEIVNEDGTMARLPDLAIFAKKHGINIGSVSALIEYRNKTETLIEKIMERPIDTIYGPAILSAFKERISDQVHCALSFGQIDADTETLVRVHVPFSIVDWLSTSDLLGRNFSIHTAMEKIGKGPGVILFLGKVLSNAELVNRLCSKNEEQATDLAWDPKLYGTGAQILKALGVGSMRLMSAPQKMPSLSGFGLHVVDYESAPSL